MKKNGDSICTNELISLENAKYFDLKKPPEVIMQGRRPDIKSISPTIASKEYLLRKDLNFQYAYPGVLDQRSVKLAVRHQLPTNESAQVRKQKMIKANLSKNKSQIFQFVETEEESMEQSERLN